MNIKNIEQKSIITEFEPEIMPDLGTAKKRDQSRLPFGYESGGLSGDGVEAGTVRLIFHKFVLEKKTIRQICKDLNESGISPARGRGWNPSSVLGILSNEAYTGKARPGGRTLPAPITAELYLQAQSQRRKNAGKNPRNTRQGYLLQGLIFCAGCNKKMKSRRLHYACPECGRASKGPGGRTGLILAAGETDRLFWAQLAVCLSEGGAPGEGLWEDRSMGAESHSPVNTGTRPESPDLLPESAAGLQKEKKSIIHLFQKGLIGQAEAESYLGAVNEKLSGVEAEVLRREYARHKSRLLADLALLIKKGGAGIDFAAKRKIVEQVTEKISVMDNGVEIYLQSEGAARVCLVLDGNSPGAKRPEAAPDGPVTPPGRPEAHQKAAANAAGGRQKRATASRKLILDAAREIFLEKGYLKTSMKEISDRAGVGYGTIYNHFTGKDDLLTHLTGDILDDFKKNAELEYRPENIEDVNRMNYREQTYFLSLAVKHRPLLKVVKEAAGHSPRIEEYNNQLFQQYVDKAVAGIGYSQARGLARPLDKKIMAKSKMFLINRFFWDIVFERENDPEIIVSNIVGLFSAGLYVPKDPAAKNQNRTWEE